MQMPGEGKHSLTALQAQFSCMMLLAVQTAVSALLPLDGCIVKCNLCTALLCTAAGRPLSGQHCSLHGAC